MSSRTRSKTPKKKVILDNTFITQSDIALSFSRENISDKSIKSTNKHQLNRPLKSVKLQVSYSFSDLDTNALEEMLSDALNKRQKDSIKVKLQHHQLPKMQLKQQEKQKQLLQKFNQIDNYQGEDHQEENYLPDYDENEDPRLDDLSVQEKAEAEAMNEETIRLKMKEIDINIKKLHLQRNRLKYFLRKDKEINTSQGEDNLSTKQCPCCGKLISKLCFRCQHLYCKVENCPRKKKQVLNARMLQKMREKKVMQPRERRSRKREKLQRKKRLKQAEGIEFDQVSSQQLSGSLSYSDQSLSISMEQAFKPMTRTTRNTGKQELDLSEMLKKSMSDASMIRNSELFLDSQDEQ